MKPLESVTVTVIWAPATAAVGVQEMVVEEVDEQPLGRLCQAYTSPPEPPEPLVVNVTGVPRSTLVGTADGIATTGSA
jgi:hypothetical protein